MTPTNPLLDFSDLPRFDLIQPEHVKPAITQLLADGRALVDRLTADSTPATWADFAGALSEGLEGFGRFGLQMLALAVRLVGHQVVLGQAGVSERMGQQEFAMA